MVGRLFRIAKNEGLRTFFYVMKLRLDNLKTDEKRYSNYIKNVEPKLFAQGSYENVVKIIHLDENMDMRELKDLIFKTEGEYIGFTTPYEVMADNAILELDKCISGYKKRGIKAGLIYWDEDYLIKGERKEPVFKPEWSPDTLMSYNYIGNGWCAEKGEVLRCCTDLDENINVALYQLLLRLTIEAETEVKHINRILSHRKSGVELSEEQMDRISAIKCTVLKSAGVSARVYNNLPSNERHELKMPIWHICYEYDKSSLISIIIPSKDNPKLVKVCIDSIIKYTPYSNYELIVVDNGSNSDNRRQYEYMLNKCPISSKYIYDEMDFNFSAMCNIGAENASGDYLLFLNDDVEILNGNNLDELQMDWLGVMAGQASQKHTGAVGVKLVYPKNKSAEIDRLQHIGVVNYEVNCFGHIYAKAEDNSRIKDYRNVADYNYLCVTAACIMLAKDKFDKVGGFNEELYITHNDVDLCIKLYKAGCHNLVRNDIVLCHHESFTRGEDGQDAAKEIRNMKERDKLYELHPDMEKYDPYYNPCLSQEENDCRVNNDIYSIFYHKPKKVNCRDFTHTESGTTGGNGGIYNTESSTTGGNGGACRTNDGNIRFEITMSEFREDLQIRGYALKLMPKTVPLINPVILLYNDKDAYLVKTTSVCDRAFHMRKGMKHFINYAPFFAGVDTSEMKGGQYRCAMINGKKSCLETGYSITIGG